MSPRPKTHQAHSRSKKRSFGGATLVGLAVIAFLFAMAYFDRSYLPIAGLYAVVSLVTFGAYSGDKAAAQNQQWRTPEDRLHLLALVGGWPGALVAQDLLRHKTRKSSFRIVFWITVVLNCLGLAWWVSTGGL